jgi:collagen type III alpha
MSQQTMIDEVIGSVRGYISRSLAPVLARLEALEKAGPVIGQKGDNGSDGKDGTPGRDGRDGKDAPPVDVEKIIAEVLLRIPTPQPGRDGRDGSNGKDGATVQELLPVMSGMVRDAVAVLPPAKDGRDGRDGKDADPVDADALVSQIVKLVPVPKDGRDGKDAAPVDVEALADRVLKLVPVPKDGRDGKDAAPVDVEALADRVLKLVPVPKDGRDGKDAAPVDVEKIALDVLSRVPIPRDGRDGAKGQDGQRGDKGADGRDGFTPDDLQFEMKGDRTLVVRMKAGDRELSREVRLAGLPVYQGVFKSGQKSTQSDLWTWGGSVWRAKRDTDTSPPGDDWQLIVKGSR